MSKGEIKSTIEKTADVDEIIIDNVLRRFEEEKNDETFWVKSEKGVVKIIHLSCQHKYY